MYQSYSLQEGTQNKLNQSTSVTTNKPIKCVTPRKTLHQIAARVCAVLMELIVRLYQFCCCCCIKVVKPETEILISEQPTPELNDIPIFLAAPESTPALPTVDVQIEEYELYEAQGRVNELYMEIISTPHRQGYFTFCPEVEAFQHSPQWCYSPLNFMMCACNRSGTFDRRNAIEQQIEDYICKTVTVDKPVCLLDFGCGGLLQTWFMVGRLIKKGYTKFDVILIDPLNTKKRLKRFRDFYENMPEIRLKVRAAESIAFLHKKYFNPQVVSAIDFDAMDASDDTIAINATKDVCHLIERFNHINPLFVFSTPFNDIKLRSGKLECITRGHPWKDIFELLSLLVRKMKPVCRVYVCERSQFILIDIIRHLQLKGISKVNIYYHYYDQESENKVNLRNIQALFTVIFSKMKIKFVSEEELGMAHFCYGLNIPEFFKIRPERVFKFETDGKISITR